MNKPIKPNQSTALGLAIGLHMMDILDYFHVSNILSLGWWWQVCQTYHMSDECSNENGKFRTLGNAWQKVYDRYRQRHLGYKKVYCYIALVLFMIWDIFPLSSSLKLIRSVECWVCNIDIVKQNINVIRSAHSASL